MKKIFLIIIAILPLVFFSGCEEVNYTVPNVSVSYRESLVNDSIVAIIRNNGEDLYGVKVGVSKLSTQTDIIEILRRGEEVEVGWLELGYGLQNGDLLQIYAFGYSVPYEISVLYR